MFGEDPYPTLFDKAAILAWTIILRHVFVDGNKRTGMAAAQVFLHLNDYFLFVTDAEMERMALKIVAHREEGLTRQDLVTWIYYQAAPKDDLWAHYP